MVISNLLLKISLLIFLMMPSMLRLQAQQFEWARAWGGASTSSWINGTDAGTSIMTDGEGNVYTTGVFKFPTDFDPGPGVHMLYPVGSDDVFVSKLDAAGHFLWVRRMGGTFLDYSREGDRGLGLTIDASGNVYITGFFKDGADFGQFNLTSNGDGDAFICKLDPAGNFVWVRQIGTSSFERGVSIALDKSGNVYTTGVFSDTMDFDPGPGIFILNAPSVTGSMFVLKLDASGNFIWAKAIGGASSTVSWSLTLDSNSNVYTTGTFSRGTNDFDPGPGFFNLTAGPSREIFISKLDSSGAFVWANALLGHPPEINNRCSTITVDPAGNVYIAGVIGDTMDFDPGPGVFNIIPLSAGYRLGGYIAKYNTSGDLIWAKNLGSGRSSFISTHAITHSPDGYLYLTGVLTDGGYVDFDPGPGVYNLRSSSNDIFILKLDTAANFVWAQQVMGPGIDFGYSIYLDPCNHIHITGSFGENADFDTGPDVFNLSSNGHGDVYVLKMSQATRPSILVDTFVLSVSKSYQSYQWYLDGNPIPGATAATHYITANGNYTVVGTNAYGCRDTTSVYSVNNAGDITAINDHDYITQHIHVYPNPSETIVHIESLIPLNATVTSMDGKIVLAQENVTSMSLDGLSAGIYLLRLSKDDIVIKTERLIKR